MEIEEKYFTEIFSKVSKLWEKTYFLEYGNRSKTYILSLGESYRKVNHIVNVEYKEKYDEWDRMLVFTMYSTLTDFGLDYLKRGTCVLNFEEVPIESFENEYLLNLRDEMNESFLKKYKGLKD